MSKLCRHVRKQLSGGESGSATVARHLSQCRACATFASRLLVARKVLRDHHAEIEPDEHFATRVAAQLADEPVVDLGWAAVRVLPATLALLVTLAWLSWSGPGAASSADPVPTEDLLTWALDQTDGGS